MDRKKYHAIWSLIKVLIDLPSEGRREERMVEGSRKYRRKKRFLQAGSRREETIWII